MPYKCINSVDSFAIFMLKQHFLCRNVLLHPTYDTLLSFLLHIARSGEYRCHWTTGTCLAKSCNTSDECIVMMQFSRFPSGQGLEPRFFSVQSIFQMA